MLKIKLLSLVCFITITASAVHARTFNELSKGPRFSITNGALDVNGTMFNKPWKINPFLTAVGGKYSTKHLFHKVYTFNDVGIHVYEYQQGSIANEVQLSFVKQKMNFAPKLNFNGSFKIEKMVITRKTDISKVQKSLPNYNFVSSGANSYRGEYKGVYIYLNYSKDRLIDFISFGTVGVNS